MCYPGIIPQYSNVIDQNTLEISIVFLSEKYSLFFFGITKWDIIAEEATVAPVISFSLFSVSSFVPREPHPGFGAYSGFTSRSFSSNVPDEDR